MALIQIPARPEPDRLGGSEVEQILAEVRLLRAMLDAWTLPDPPPAGRTLAPVIPINIRRG